MILTVGNTKGGVGKTTLAIQLAIARARAGANVWLIDADMQGTASAAIALRMEAGKAPGVACAQYADHKALEGQLRHQQQKWDDIIIDAGGRDSKTLRIAMMFSHAVLVPFAPRSYDVWALDDMAAILDEVRVTRSDLDAYAVLNMADPGEHSADNTEAAAAVAEVPQFTYLATPIRRRKAFSNAGGAGLGVDELPNKDPKAAAEIERLFTAVFNIQ